MTDITARPVGFVADLATVAGRALRHLPRDLEATIPPLVAGVFVLLVNIGALNDVAQATDFDLDYKAFQLPVGIVFAVTGMSRAYALVIDIQGGYFDRLLVSPVHRSALLLGLMVADVALIFVLALLIVGLGFALGVTFSTGVAGVAVFCVMSALWGLAFAAIPYSIALRTGNPGAVGGSWVLSFPFILLTSALVPLEAMSGWLEAVARLNPVTYLLEGQRSLFTGWDGRALLEGAAAIVVVAAVTMPIAFLSLRARARPD